MLDAAVEDLRAGETQIEIFEVELTEISPVTGVQDTATVVPIAVTITGSNDTPDITVETGDLDAAALTETDDALSTTGTLSVSDLDVGDTVTATSALATAVTTAPTQPDDADLEAMFSILSNPVIGSDANSGSISWSFDSTPEAFDYLAESEVLTLTYTVTATDDSPSGATSDTQDVVITIVGTNDAPVIDDVVSVVTGEVTELVDGSPIETISLNEVGGTITFSDLDLSNTHFTGFAEQGNGAGAEGEFLGSFSIDAIQDQPDNQGNTFQWSLTIQDSELEFLAEGQTASQSYTVLVSDQNDGTDTTVVTVSFTGRNDAPEFTVQAGDVTDLIIDETDGTLFEAGTLSLLDIDLIDEVSLDVELTTVEGVFRPDLVEADFDGLLSLTTTNPVLNGTETLDRFTYQFNSDGEAYNHLNDGESLVATYTVTATDLEGATALQDITVTIIGTNDEPGIEVVLLAGDSDLENLDETDAGLEVSGTLSVVDVDISDVVTVEAALQAVNDTPGGGAPAAGDLEGFFSVDSGEVVSNTETTGTINWSFNSGTEAFDYLANGEVLELEYLVTALDGPANDPTTETDTQVVTIVITGSNDDPTIAVNTGAGDSASGDVTEANGALLADGTLSVEDLDLSDSVTPSTALSSSVSASPEVQAVLDALGTAGLEAMFSVSPDPVVDAGATTGSLAWSFNSGEEAFNELALDEVLTLTFTVTVTDTELASATQDVVITITGTNDDPTLEAGAIPTAVEDGEPQTLDLATLGDDVDSDDDGASLTYTIAADPSEGSASIDGTELTFDAGEDFQDLAVGETREVTVGIAAEDSNGGTATADVTVTVTGVNDDPTLAAGTGAADEDGAAVEVDLALLGDDVDSDDDGSTLTYAVTGDPSEGSASVNGTTLTFDPGADFQDLALGETRDVTVTVTATDTHGATATNTVTITVTGTNDAPTVEPISLEADENGDPVGALLEPFGDDPDSNDDGSTLTYSIGSDPALGSAEVVVDPVTGAGVVFDAAGDFESLSAGETTTTTFEVTATDSEGATGTGTVTVTVTGENDGPVIGAADTTGSVTEDDAFILETTGVIEFTDVDLNDFHVVSATADPSNSLGGMLEAFETVPAFGGVTGNAFWRYTLDSGLVDGLALGETGTELFTVTIDDENGGTVTQDVTITVNGANDDPTLAAGVGAAVEDGEPTEVDLALLGDDVDSDDDGSTLTYTVSGDPSEGTASIDGTTLTFDPGADFQDLADGETRDVTVEVTATDTHGGTAINDVTITVTGANDAPTMADGAGAADEDGAAIDVDLAVLGDDTDSDDDGATLTYAITTVPSEGSASINGTTLTFDPGTDFQDLSQGETRQVTVGVTATDSQTATSNEGTITITVTGTNDAPIIGAGVFEDTVTELADGAPNEDVQVTNLTQQISFGDVDLGDGHQVNTTAQGTGFVGDFSATVLDLSTGDGAGTVAWNFQISDADLAFLGDGEAVIQQYEVSIVDDAADSLSDTTVVSITLVGANDAPDVVEIDLGSIADNQAPVEFDLLDPASVSDPDGDVLEIPSIDIVSSDGRTLTPAPVLAGGLLTFDPSAFADLVDGESAVVTITYDVSDGLATVTNTATVTVTGASDGVFVGTADADNFQGDPDEFDLVDYSNSDGPVEVILDVLNNGGFATDDVLENIDGVEGSDFDDNLVGNEEDNSLFGGLGNDTVEGGPGNDFMDGGEGIDTLSFENAGVGLSGFGVIIDLSIQGDPQNLAEGEDTFIGFENVVGSQLSDLLQGDEQANTLTGLDGRDFLLGLDGEDVLYGGDDFDLVEGGEGVDSLFGGTNSDGGPEADVVAYFGVEEDMFFDLTVPFRLPDGTVNPNNMSSQAILEDFIANDFEGFAGSNNFSNTFDIASDFFNNGRSFVLGGRNTDTFFGGDGTDQLLGLGGDDVFFGNDGVDALIGEGGNDDYFGGGGGDFFFFDGLREGDDIIHDFEAGLDLIAFFGGNITDTSQIQTSLLDLDGDMAADDALLTYESAGFQSSISVLNTTEEDAIAGIIFI